MNISQEGASEKLEIIRLVVFVHYVVFDNKTASFLLLSVNWFAYCVTMLINAVKTAHTN
jgi:hypothetical protein